MKLVTFSKYKYSEKWRYKDQDSHDRYSTIKIPVNRYVEFSLKEVTTTLSDGRSIELDEDNIETISDFSPLYYPDSKTKILHIPLTRAGAISTVSYKIKYKSLLYLTQFFRQRDIPTYNSWLEVRSDIPYVYYVSENDFIVFVQNGEELLSDNMYLEHIDGIGREDVFYDDEEETDDDWRDDIIDDLNKALDEDKAVLVIDYTYDYRYDFYKLCIDYGFMPYAADRDLDYLDEYMLYPAT